MQNSKELNDVAVTIKPEKKTRPLIVRIILFFFLPYLFFTLAFYLEWKSIGVPNKFMLRGFCGFSIIYILIFGGIPFIGLNKRNNRRSEQSKFAASVGFDYNESPSKADGYNITVGSVIASGGDADWPYDSLLSGRRDGYSFRAIDYGYWVKGARGGGNMIQTVICIDLQQTNVTPFSIIDRDLLDHCPAAGKIQSIRPSLNRPLNNFLPKNRVIVVNQDDHYNLTISCDFWVSFAHMKNANVEYLGDRLLVYSIYQKFNGAEYLAWIDYAISLAK